jgi:uroporphyrinogen decarboxylase
MTANVPILAPAVDRMTGQARLLAAARRSPVDATPVWFMRQAGGSLPRYLTLRERHSVEAIARTPELCAEVSLMPVEAYGVDGAVMFADIMLPVAAMGVELGLTSAGPVIASPIRSATDVERLRPLDPEADVRFILEAIAIVRHELAGRAALIGLTGGPFTLACYLIEGGPSRDQAVAKAFMHREPDAWVALMDRLTVALSAYVEAQVRAGAELIQVFDSWAGTLGPADYVRFAFPYSRRVLEAAGAVPTIHFGVGTAGILDQMASAGGDIIGIDARQSLAEAWLRLDADRAIQGNLEPARLLAGWPVIEAGARAVLDEAGGQLGHIFNLGHAAPRETDPVLLRELVSFVHSATTRQTP